MPSLARDDEDRLGADIGIRLHDLPRGGKNLGLFLLALDVLAIELLCERAHLLAEGLVGRQQEPRRNVRRAHPAGRVHTRSQHERHMETVDRLARQAGDVEQRTKADFVRAL